MATEYRLVGFYWDTDSKRYVSRVSVGVNRRGVDVPLSEDDALRYLSQLVFVLGAMHRDRLNAGRS